MHPFIGPFLERANAAPVAEDGKRHLRLLAHDLARVRNSLARGDGGELAVLRQSDKGDSYFEAALADGSRVRVERVGAAVQQLVDDLGVSRADELAVSKARDALVGTPEGIAQQRTDPGIDKVRHAVHGGGRHQTISDAEYAELIAAGVTSSPEGQRP